MLEITTPAPPSATTAPEFLEGQRHAEKVHLEDGLGCRLHRRESRGVHDLFDRSLRP